LTTTRSTELSHPHRAKRTEARERPDFHLEAVGPELIRGPEDNEVGRNEDQKALLPHGDEDRMIAKQEEERASRFVVFGTKPG
jgi:hypothetical protein